MPTDLWAYLRPERPALACGGAALLVSTFSNAFAPRAMGRVVDAYAARRRDGGARAVDVHLEKLGVAVRLAAAGGARAAGIPSHMVSKELESPDERPSDRGTSGGGGGTGGTGEREDETDTDDEE